MDSPSKLRQQETDDHNRFQIKTKKKKKRDDPRHKVVVVDSKKFKKLKRQASELEKVIKEGEHMKTQMD